MSEFDYQYDDVLAWMPIPEFSTMQNLHKGSDFKSDPLKLRAVCKQEV